MDGRFRGTFPGGPSRRQAHEPGALRPRTLRTVEQIGAMADRMRLARTHRERLRRALLGSVFVVFAAVAAGFVVGLQSHRSAQQIAEERSAANGRDMEISKEVNRALLELWKMEEAEALRNERWIR